MAGQESKWTETYAVAGKDFVERIKNKLGARAGPRKAETENGDFVLREKRHYWRSSFAQEKGTLSNTIRLKKILSLL
jgi:hypothetical protein